ncbi:MAG TPA: VCBS repeat-containing protein, partial [Flavitalea sp.]|nr:VCBS repeat-containing protein [Flavitalea sp.]
KKYLKYDGYKNQTVEDIFNPEQLKSARKLSASCMESSVFLNNKAGKFIRKPLPVEAQLSSMYSILTYDFDGDGKQDLLLGGNFYEAKPEAGIYAASYGCYLKGQGNGNFDYVPMDKSGLAIEGAVRDMILIRQKNNLLMLTGRNNASIQIEKIIKPKR